MVLLNGTDEDHKILQRFAKNIAPLSVADLDLEIFRDC